MPKNPPTTSSPSTKLMLEKLEFDEEYKLKCYENCLFSNYTTF